MNLLSGSELGALFWQKSLKRGSSVHVDIAQGVELLLLALREAVPTARSCSDKVLEGKLGKEKVAEMSASILEYLETGVNQTLTRNEQLALTIQCVKYLAAYLRQMEVPITLNNLAANYGLLSEAVDRCFPYYAQSRLLKYIIAPCRN